MNIIQPADNKDIGSREELREVFQHRRGQFAKETNPLQILERCESVAEEVTAAAFANKWNPEFGDQDDVLPDILRLRTVCHNARQAHKKQDPEAIAAAFFQLGQWSTILQMRRFEPYIECGKKQLDRDNKGGRKRTLLPPMPELQREFKELLNQGIGETDARRRMAHEHGTSEPTIRRRLEA